MDGQEEKIKKNQKILREHIRADGKESDGHDG